MSQQGQDFDAEDKPRPETTGRTSTREVQQASEQRQNERSETASENETAWGSYVYREPAYPPAYYPEEPQWMQDQQSVKSKSKGVRREELQCAAAAQQNASAPDLAGTQTSLAASVAIAEPEIPTASATKGTQSTPVQRTAIAPFPALVQTAPAAAAVQPTLTTQQAAAAAAAPSHDTSQAPAPAPGAATGQGAQTAPATQSAPVQQAATTSVPPHIPSAPAAAVVQPTPTTQQTTAAPTPQAALPTQASQLAANHNHTPWAYQLATFPTVAHVLTPPEVLARYPTGIPLQNGTPQLRPNEVLPSYIRVLPPAPRQAPIPIVQSMASYIGTSPIPQHIANYVNILRTQSLGLSSTKARAIRQKFDRNGPPAAQHVFNNKWGVLQNHNTQRPGGRLYAELFYYWMDYRLFDHDEWWEMITRPGNHGRVWPHAPWQRNVL